MRGQKGYTYSIEEIRDARRQKGITVIELAAAMGVSLRYLIQLEKGEIAAIPEQIELIRSIIDDWPRGMTRHSITAVPNRLKLPERRVYS